MDLQRMRAEMIGWLERHGGSADMVASFTGHWNLALQDRTGPPEGPCPACFREGRLAFVEVLSIEGPLSRAQCMECGSRYLWSGQA
jgi:hypothetical protein